MADDAEWKRLIAEVKRPPPIVAQTYVKRWDTFSKPALFTCTDGKDYVVKAPRVEYANADQKHQLLRSLFNDHVVAFIGTVIGAPVAAPALASVPEELLKMEPEIKYIDPTATAHATMWQPGCSERLGFEHIREAINRERFAKLAVLHTLGVTTDTQFIYETNNPHRVFCVDHGHSFPGAPPVWSVSTLDSHKDVIVSDFIITNAQLEPTDMAPALNELVALTDVVIAQAVATPPDSWSVSNSERVAVAKFLASRRDAMLLRCR